MKSQFLIHVDEGLAAIDGLAHAMKSCGFRIHSCDSCEIEGIIYFEGGWFRVEVNGIQAVFKALPQALEKFLEWTEH